MGKLQDSDSFKEELTLADILFRLYFGQSQASCFPVSSLSTKLTFTVQTLKWYTPPFNKKVNEHISQNVEQASTVGFLHYTEFTMNFPPPSKQRRNIKK